MLLFQSPRGIFELHPYQGEALVSVLIFVWLFGSHMENIYTILTLVTSWMDWQILSYKGNL